MIQAVMVTIKVDRTDHEYDMELPANLKIAELSSKLLDSFKNIESDMFRTIERIKLRFDGEDRFLEDEETLESACVWDGNIITVVKEDW